MLIRERDLSKENKRVFSFEEDFDGWMTSGGTILRIHPIKASSFMLKGVLIT